ncbi:carbohydrate porin, partial [Bradyrhizobium sp. CCBAU 11434]|uniref:carbohydrate porin n=1 Tax=Bradyrhizobium sp. CCBAU 11434 TaxID=1630885 RepID=UPI0023064568
INDPPLAFYEAQFQWNAKKGDPGLDGKLKLGGWRHFGSFNYTRFDTAGLSLANPASSGTPAILSGDYGLYAVFEQKLFRVGHDDDRGTGVFAQASYSPPAQNLIMLRWDRRRGPKSAVGLGPRFCAGPIPQGSAAGRSDRRASA